jgi:hypothetical protein
MHPVLSILSQGLEASTRLALQNRIDILMRGIRFEAEKHSRFFKLARSKGWDLHKIEIICCLNAFYQIVLGPLASASRTSIYSGLLVEHPISYGTKIIFDKEHIDRIKDCHHSFLRLLQDFDINFWTIQANHATDLLYRLADIQSQHD